MQTTGTEQRTIRNCIFSFERKGLAGILNCNGSITTDDAQSLRDALMTCMDHTDHIIINCRDLKSIDIPCIQLFCIAYRIAIRSQKKFIIMGMDEEIYNPIIDEVGNICSSHSTLGCSSSCLWVPGKSTALA